MKVFLGSDHRGFELKNTLLEYVKSLGYEVQDCGALEYNKEDDYPDFAKAVGEKIVEDNSSLGIVICGSGAGITVAANKIKGVRCSLGFNPMQVKSGKEDDDTNILGIACNYTNESESKELVKIFLETNYDPAERHQRRLDKISQMESIA